MLSRGIKYWLSNVTSVPCRNKKKGSHYILIPSTPTSYKIVTLATMTAVAPILRQLLHCTGTYVIGEFDGHTFTEKSKARYFDYGPDNYAAVTFNNTKDRIAIGWMNNWPYHNTTPADQWRGMQSLPRELSLVRHDDQLVIFSRPTSELMALPADQHSQYSDLNVSAAGHRLSDKQSAVGIIQLDFDLHIYNIHNA